MYISGEQYISILKAGDIIGFKEINSFDYIIYGEMYLISFHIDDSEYLAVKYIGRSEKNDCLRMISYNQHHEPTDLPFANVQAMAIVKFSIRKNMML